MRLRRIPVPSPKRQRVLPNGHPVGTDGRLPLETDYVRALMARCAVELPHVRLFRRNTGMIPVDDRMFRAGIPGQCDLYALAKGGRHFEIECKRFGRLSEAQERWRAWCFGWGVPWLLLEVRRTEQPAETVTRWVREVSEFVAPPSGLGR
jgi:hypothetical protein